MNQKSILFRIKKFRLHIGLVLALPYMIFGLLTALAIMDWNWNLIKSSGIQILIGTLISIFLSPVFFLINDYFDVPFDKLDPVKRRKNVFCVNTSRSTKIYGLLIVVLSVIIFLSLSYYISFEIFVIAIIMTFLSAFYSAPPIRIKEIPFLDFIAHGVALGGSFFILGGSLISPVSILFAHPIFVLLLIFSVLDGAWIQYISQLADFKIDLIAHQRTTSVWLGFPRNIWIFNLIMFCMLCCLPLYFLLTNFFQSEILFDVVLLLLILLPVSFLYVVSRNRSMQIENLLQTALKYRIGLIYPFAIFSVLFINPLALFSF